jgi:hypothetical protein
LEEESIDPLDLATNLLLHAIRNCKRFAKALFSTFATQINQIMNLRQRFTRYLIGVGIGVLLCFAMFPNANLFGWTPNSHIMRAIRENNMVILQKAQCQMACAAIGQEQLQLARTSGKVDISKSYTHSDPKKYFLEYGEMSFDILLNDTLAQVAEVRKNGVMCNCP